MTAIATWAFFGGKLGEHSSSWETTPLHVMVSLRYSCVLPTSRMFRSGYIKWKCNFITFLNIYRHQRGKSKWSEQVYLHSCRVMAHTRPHQSDSPVLCNQTDTHICSHWHHQHRSLGDMGYCCIHYSWFHTCHPCSPEGTHNRNHWRHHDKCRHGDRGN